MSIIEALNASTKNGSKISGGVTTGIVTNNKDPDGLGRVKLKISRLSGNDETDWIRVVSFMAGKDMGAFFLPEVEDEVLVAFEYDNINMPYVIGSLWNGVDKPPETNSSGENNIRLIKSRSGHCIKIDDKKGAEKIEITDKTGKNLITIDSNANKISINAEQDIELNASKGKIAIKAKEIEIKASGEINLKGSTINLN